MSDGMPPFDLTGPLEIDCSDLVMWGCKATFYPELEIVKVTKKSRVGALRLKDIAYEEDFAEILEHYAATVAFMCRWDK